MATTTFGRYSNTCSSSEWDDNCFINGVLCDTLLKRHTTSGGYDERMFTLSIPQAVFYYQHSEGDKTLSRLTAFSDIACVQRIRAGELENAFGTPLAGDGGMRGGDDDRPRRRGSADSVRRGASLSPRSVSSMRAVSPVRVAQAGANALYTAAAAAARISTVSVLKSSAPAVLERHGFVVHTRRWGDLEALCFADWQAGTWVNALCKAAMLGSMPSSRASRGMDVKQSFPKSRPSAAFGRRSTRDGDESDKKVAHGHKVKTIIIGDVCAGKTAFARRLCEDVFTEGAATVGVDFFTKVDEVDGEHVKLTVWDTAGQEQYGALSRAYYRDAQVAILVFDTSLQRSSERCLYWFRHLRANCNTADIITVLALSKVDLRPWAQSQVEAYRGFAMQHGMLFFETSARTGAGVADAFRTILRRYLAESRLHTLGQLRESFPLSRPTAVGEPPAIVGPAAEFARQKTCACNKGGT
eukprot:NODE_7270_length_1594_cov_6.473074.p1 GENE.NODE_7270_length_1594_cov_6.473074~~NODE_7270_length_1594_cov_6.473074.p1  ORF type:complete len:469 (+),score=89.57 NODE_7270_length_1594_cov_6.473074:153-1559(+)